MLQRNFYTRSSRERLIVDGRLNTNVNFGLISVLHTNRSKFKYGPDHVDILSNAAWRIGELPELTNLYTTATAKVLLAVVG